MTVYSTGDRVGDASSVVHTVILGGGLRSLVRREADNHIDYKYNHDLVKLTPSHDADHFPTEEHDDN